MPAHIKIAAVNNVTVVRYVKPNTNSIGKPRHKWIYGVWYDREARQYDCFYNHMRIFRGVAYSTVEEAVARFGDGKVKGLDTTCADQDPRYQGIPHFGVRLLTHKELKPWNDNHRYYGAFINGKPIIFKGKTQRPCNWDTPEEAVKRVLEMLSPTVTLDTLAKATV